MYIIWCKLKPWWFKQCKPQDTNTTATMKSAALALFSPNKSVLGRKKKKRKWTLEMFCKLSLHSYPARRVWLLNVRAPFFRAEIQSGHKMTQMTLTIWKVSFSEESQHSHNRHVWAKERHLHQTYKHNSIKPLRSSWKMCSLSSSKTN